jgi:hypothetical protein
MASLSQLQSALSKFRQLVSECRTSTRQPFDTPVDLTFRDGSGRITQGRARCVDISEHGARIAYYQPIVLPAVMQIRFESNGAVKMGHVRHCTPNGAQYDIGIQFLSPEELRGLAKKPMFV